MGEGGGGVVLVEMVLGEVLGEGIVGVGDSGVVSFILRRWGNLRVKRDRWSWWLYWG